MATSFTTEDVMRALDLLEALRSAGMPDELLKRLSRDPSAAQQVVSYTAFFHANNPIVMHDWSAETRLNEVDLEARIYGNLMRRGIVTLGDVAELTEGELEDISNVGPLTVDKIKTTLAMAGLELRQ